MYEHPGRTRAGRQVSSRNEDYPWLELVLVALVVLGGVLVQHIAELLLV